MSYQYEPKWGPLVVVMAPSGGAPVPPNVGRVGEVIWRGDGAPAVAVVHTMEGPLMIPCDLLEEVQGQGVWHMCRLLAAATRVTAFKLGVGCASKLQPLHVDPDPDAKVDQPVPTVSYSTVTMPATTCKFASQAVRGTLAAMRQSVSRAYVLGVSAAHLFLRACFASGLHHDPEVFNLTPWPPTSTTHFNGRARSSTQVTQGHRRARLHSGWYSTGTGGGLWAACRWRAQHLPWWRRTRLATPSCYRTWWTCISLSMCAACAGSP